MSAIARLLVLAVAALCGLASSAPPANAQLIPPILAPGTLPDTPPVAAPSLPYHLIPAVPYHLIPSVGYPTPPPIPALPDVWNVVTLPPIPPAPSVPPVPPVVNDAVPDNPEECKFPAVNIWECAAAWEPDVAVPPAPSPTVPPLPNPSLPPLPQPPSVPRPPTLPPLVAQPDNPESCKFPNPDEQQCAADWFEQVAGSPVPGSPVQVDDPPSSCTTTSPTPNSAAQCATGLAGQVAPVPDTPDNPEECKFPAVDVAECVNAWHVLLTGGPVPGSPVQVDDPPPACTQAPPSVTSVSACVIGLTGVAPPPLPRNPDECTFPLFEAEPCLDAWIEQLAPGVQCRTAIVSDVPHIGCPANDPDGDGVPNSQDSCDDVKGPASTGGCPDSDGDGVRDISDACPGQPGTAAQGGCPDSDADNVPDNRDDCPEEPGPQDNRGCPVVTGPPAEPYRADVRSDPMEGHDTPVNEADYAGGDAPSCVDDDGDDYCPNGTPRNAREALALQEPPLADWIVPGVNGPDASLGGARDASRSPALEPGKGGWGFATQTSQTLTDARFAALGVGKVRMAVPWDVVLREQKATACGGQGDGNTAFRLAEARAFVREAETRGFDVTVAFEHCQNESEHGVLPTRDQYDEAVRAFRTEFRTVDAYEAWNEPNDPRQPTSEAKRGSLAGATEAAMFWRRLKRACDNELQADKDRGLAPCIPVAGGFNDAGTFTGPYFRKYKAGLGGRKPDFWAFHPYGTGRQKFTSGSRWPAFARNLPLRDTGARPNIWLTEVAGVYDTGPREARRSDAAVERDLRWLMNDFIDSEPTIKRFYYYGWVAPTVASDQFDTHMLSAPARASDPMSRAKRRSTYYIYKNVTTGA